MRSLGDHGRVTYTVPVRTSSLNTPVWAREGTSFQLNLRRYITSGNYSCLGSDFSGILCWVNSIRKAMVTYSYDSRISFLTYSTGVVVYVTLCYLTAAIKLHKRKNSSGSHCSFA